MPPHNHSASVSTVGDHTHTIPHSPSSSGGGNAGYWMDRPNGSHNTGESGNHSHNVTIQNAGGGQKANNMQPYIVVNYWQRIN